jgi:bacteriocin-like protein
MNTLNQKELSQISGGKENPNDLHCLGHAIKGFFVELFA